VGSLDLDVSEEVGRRRVDVLVGVSAGGMEAVEMGVAGIRECQDVVGRGRDSEVMMQTDCPDYEPRHCYHRRRGSPLLHALAVATPRVARTANLP
jgi:hypothetical protein